MAGLIGVVGRAAASSPGPAGSAPDKTVAPTAPGTAPSGAPAPGVPPTSAWIATTTITTTTAVPPAVTATTLATTDANSATTIQPVAPTAGFDGLTFLTDVYAAVNGDPLTLIDVAEGTTIINSAADLWVAHLLTVSMTNRIQGGPPPPAYIVSPEGKGVSVCADTGTCESFGDFYAPTGLLESFTINGVALDDAMSISTRQIVVESLIVDTALCIKPIEGPLSCVVIVSSEGAAAALMFEQATFIGLDGQHFLPDLNVSAFPASVADGGFGSAHLVFAGAPLDGDLTFPVVSGVSGVASTVSVPVRTL